MKNFTQATSNECVESDGLLISYDDAPSTESAFTCSGCGAVVSFLAQECSCGASLTGSIHWPDEQ